MDFSIWSKVKKPRGFKQSRYLAQLVTFLNFSKIVHAKHIYFNINSVHSRIHKLALLRGVRNARKTKKTMQNICVFILKSKKTRFQNNKTK